MCDCLKLAFSDEMGSLAFVKRIPRLAGTTLAGALAALLLPLAAQAFDPYLEVPGATEVERSPAYQHANATSQTALQELRARGILFQQEGTVRGVDTPVRLTGRLRGVHIHSALPEAQRVTTPFEICDARLALALDDFAQLLAKHDIDEVVHYSMYRPAPLPRRSRTEYLPVLPGPSKSVEPLPPLPLPEVGTSASAGPTGSAPPTAAACGSSCAESKEAAPRTSRHPAGLAIDVAKLHKRSGEWLDVAAHFAGQLGARTCGAGVAVPADPKAQELRAIVCEAANARLFTYMLSPNYNLAHRDHFHLEIKPATRWFLVH